MIVGGNAVELGRYKPHTPTQLATGEEEAEVGEEGVGEEGQGRGAFQPAVASTFSPAPRDPDHQDWCKQFVYSYAFPTIGKQAMGSGWGTKPPPPHLTVVFVLYAVLKVLNLTPSAVTDQGSYVES